MLKCKPVFLIAALAFSVLISIPIFGKEFNYNYHQSYHDIIYDFSVSGEKTISIATYDQRSYILSEEKTANFVGLGRVSYGIPSGVGTLSGNPLADDLTKSITASLVKKGFKCTPVTTVPSDSIDTVLENLKASSSDIIVLLTLDEWRSDTIKQTRVTYDINLKIYDKTGLFITENTLQGEDILQKKFGTTPIEYAQTAVPKTYKIKMEELFNNPNIIKALQ